MNIFYDKRFHIGKPIEDHNIKVRNTIGETLGKNQVLIDSTHLDITSELKDFVKVNRGKQFLIYSGMDWENTKCRPNVHDFLKNEIDELVYIGNSNTDYYFSFWLDFVNEHKPNYQVNNFPYKIEKMFMSLNRKPHDHRVELVKRLIDCNLHIKGYVSLGLPDGDHRGIKFPLILDSAEDTDLGMYGNYSKIPNDILSLSGYWDKHLITVVAETTHHTDVFLSEKIFKPVLGLRPFIVLGDRKVYEKLKHFGFDTYDDIFGTGYAEQWHTQRIQWIIDSLLKLNIRDYTEYLLELRPRLEYNLKQFDTAVEMNKKVIHQDWSKI